MSPPLLRPMLNANQNTNIVTTGFTRAHDQPKADPLYVVTRHWAQISKAQLLKQHIRQQKVLYPGLYL